MSRASREKGARGERELAKEFARLFGVEAYRGRQYHGRDDAPDIVCGIPGVHVECKRTEALSLYPAMEQAKADAGDSVPIVVHRRNGKPWLVVVELENLLELSRSIVGTKLC